MGALVPARRLERHAAELVRQRLDGSTVLEAESSQDADGVSHPRKGGTLLGNLDEQLARAAVLVLPDREVAVLIAQAETVGHALAGVGKATADSPCRLFKGHARRLAALVRGQRLRHLRPVAVDGNRLHPRSPGVDVEAADVLRRSVVGNVDGLGDTA